MSELQRVLAALDLRAREMMNDARQREYADAARLLREMAADFERAWLEKHSREWLDAAREKWRLE